MASDEDQQKQFDILNKRILGKNANEDEWNFSSSHINGIKYQVEQWHYAPTDSVAVKKISYNVIAYV